MLVCSLVAVRGVRVFAEKRFENERYSFIFMNEKVRVKFRFFKILVVGTIPRFFSLLRADDAPSRTDE